MNKNNGIKTGLTVTFTRESAELLERDALEIFEVTDSRHTSGGRYLFTLTPVQDPPALNAKFRDVDPFDLAPVG
jgi:hypothetical protein